MSAACQRSASCGKLEMSGAKARLGRLIAPRDIHADGFLGAFTPRDLDGLPGAFLYIRPVGRCDSRWESMCPIPRDIVGVGVTDIT